MRQRIASHHTDALRWTLLTALGLAPLSACGGNTSSDGAGGAAQGGRSAGSGGNTALGGAPTFGGSVGLGGAATFGGSLGSGGNEARGGTSASTGGKSAGSGGSATGPKFPCASLGPLPNDPTASVEQCQGGWKHRTKVVACPSNLPRSTVLPPSNYPQYDECLKDADCTLRPNGHCEGPNSHELALPTNGCMYGCTSDADCQGGICECGADIGTCITSSCKTDADCGPNLLCASYVNEPGCNFPAYACQTQNDTCVGAADCPSTQACTVDRDGSSRHCSEQTCVIGRPFLVGGELCCADTVPRSDWRAGAAAAPAVERLTEAERAALAESWARIGCLEHASIAAFARFALELLAFGAPRELVELTNEALRDETHHAELAFALASAYHGAPLGPGKLSFTGALTAPDLRASVLSALLEGCMGETVAAHEAAAASEAASDPAVRSVLARIAVDETRHAALAFRFVKWALGELEPGFVDELRARARAELAFDAIEEPQPISAALRAHGMLGDAERRELRRLALSQVVLPCLDALAQNTAGSVYVPNTDRSTSQISCCVA